MTVGTTTIVLSAPILESATGLTRQRRVCMGGGGGSGTQAVLQEAVIGNFASAVPPLGYLL